VIPPTDRYCAAVCRNAHVIKDDLEPPPQPPTSTGLGITEGGVNPGTGGSPSGRHPRR